MKMGNLKFGVKTTLLLGTACALPAAAAAGVIRPALNGVYETLTAAAYSEEPLLGDVDGDWYCNARDAALILGAAVMAACGNGSAYLEIADVNGDGKCDALDASYILIYARTQGMGYEAIWEDIVSPREEAAEDAAISVEIDSIDITGDELEALNYQVPIYVRVDYSEELPVSAWAFGLYVDERCEYTVITNSRTAVQNGGETLRYTPYACSENEDIWLSCALDNSFYDGNVALVMVTLPEDVKSGDAFSITYQRESIAAEPHIWYDCNAGIDYTTGDNVTWKDGLIRVYAGPTTDPGAEILPGDVNQDEKVTIIDVIYLNKAIMGAEVLDDAQQTAADCDKDGGVTPTDSLMILKSLVKLITL